MRNRGANRTRLLSRLSGAHAGFLTSVLLLSATAFVPEAAAQQQLRQSRSQVEIDWSVLDELDRPPTQRIILRPPSASSAPAVETPSEPKPAPRPQLHARKPAPEKKSKPVATAKPAPQKTAKAAPVKQPAPPTAESAHKVEKKVAAAPAPAFTPPSPPPSFTDTPPSRAASTVPVAAAPAGAPPPPPPSVAARAVSSSPLAPTPLAPRPVEPPVAAAPPPPAPAIAAPAIEEPKPAPVAVAAATPEPVPAPPVVTPPLPSQPLIATPASTAPVQVATSPAAEAAPAAGQQLASLPPATVGGDGRLAIVSFATGAADLPEAARNLLDRTAAEMKRDESARLQLVAYAAGNDDASSQARRLSLSRALAVRSYLIEHGVRSTRMDVRALGNKVPEGPPDRVDVMLVRR